MPDDYCRPIHRARHYPACYGAEGERSGQISYRRPGCGSHRCRSRYRRRCRCRIAAGTIATSATDAITADAALRSRVEAATPLRRLGTVEDVAAAVVYLASPAGAYLTGAVLEVHSGLLAPSTQQPIPDL